MGKPTTHTTPHDRPQITAAVTDWLWMLVERGMDAEDIMAMLRPVIETQTALFEAARREAAVREAMANDECRMMNDE